MGSNAVTWFFNCLWSSRASIRFAKPPPFDFNAKRVEYEQFPWRIHRCCKILRKTSGFSLIDSIASSSCQNVTTMYKNWNGVININVHTCGGAGNALSSRHVPSDVGTRFRPITDVIVAFSAHVTRNVTSYDVPLASHTQFHVKLTNVGFYNNDLSSAKRWKIRGVGSKMLPSRGGTDKFPTEKRGKTWKHIPNEDKTGE